MKPREIDIPLYIQKGIRHRSSGFPNRIRFFAGDVETHEGKPITLQLADSDSDATLYWVDEETILSTFLAWIFPRLLRKKVNVCFFHFLAHDLPALLYKDVSRFTENQFSLQYGGIKISVLAAKIFYAKITFPDKTVLHLIDTFRFYTTSLEKIGKTLGCKNMKLKKPAGLGEKRFTPADRDFVEYAKQDAMLGYEVGRHVIKIHEEFDIPLSISAPQFAARVFTRYYLEKDETIRLPNRLVLRASLLSYHGGKNGFYVKPGLYRNVTELDISSAYPNAMRKLPQMVEGRFEHTSEFDSQYVGVYQVSGTMKECRYSVFLTHDGKPIQGPCAISDLWVTSYELEESLRTGEFVPEKISGWRWIPDPSYTRNPLASFVHDFYEKKENCPRGNPEYLTYKLLLNSCYGKFIQNVEKNSELQSEWTVNEDGTRTRVKKTYKAGGLFNPFIATLITGEVRAYLHRLEHEYNAIHASTDSIKTREKISPASLPKGLGGLNVEIEGDCILLRNKLYLHFDGEMNGVRPKKYALHGFWGNVDDLLSLVEKRETRYTVKHLYRVREALVQGLVPLRTYIQKREVQIEWEEYQSDIRGMADRAFTEEKGIAGIPEAFWISGKGVPYAERERGSKGQGDGTRPVLSGVEGIDKEKFGGL